MEQEQLDASRERLIAALDDWQESHDPCEDGHVDHVAADHLGRRMVHTFAGAGGMALGADWDYAAAVEYIGSAVEVVRANAQMVAMGHAGAARSPEGRWIVFATKKDS